MEVKRNTWDPCPGDRIILTVTIIIQAKILLPISIMGLCQRLQEVKINGNRQGEDLYLNQAATPVGGLVTSTRKCQVSFLCYCEFNSLH